MWFKERPSMPLQKEFITKGGQYCKCHVFYSMLVHGPVSGYNSLLRSGKTGGLWGDMLRYFCPPASLTTHDNQYSHTTNFLPYKKNTRWRTEGLWRLLLLTALFMLLVQRVRDWAALFQECCFAVYIDNYLPWPSHNKQNGTMSEWNDLDWQQFH